MDLKVITWVGHVYQMFQGLCLEVEEMMYETVGASVKRFYSEVVQDLLPQSADTVKAAAEAPPSSDTSPKIHCSKCRKPNMDLKVETINLADQELTKDSVLAANATNEGESRHISHDTKCYQTHKVPSSNPVESDWPDFLESDCDDSEHPLLAKSSAAEKEIQRASSIGVQGELNGEFRDVNTFYSKVSSFNGDEEGNSEEVALALPSSLGRSDDGKVKNVWCNRVGGAIQQYVSTRGVDGSLVIVNGQEQELGIGDEGQLQQQHKRRTYKKKIRDAISTRLRSARKKKYQQSAGWQEENEHHQTLNNPELEWELI